MVVFGVHYYRHGGLERLLAVLQPVGEWPWGGHAAGVPTVTPEVPEFTKGGLVKGV